MLDVGKSFEHSIDAPEGLKGSIKTLPDTPMSDDLQSELVRVTSVCDDAGLADWVFAPQHSLTSRTPLGFKIRQLITYVVHDSFPTSKFWTRSILLQTILRSGFQGTVKRALYCKRNQPASSGAYQRLRPALESSSSSVNDKCVTLQYIVTASTVADVCIGCDVRQKNTTCVIQHKCDAMSLKLSDVSAFKVGQWAVGLKTCLNLFASCSLSFIFHSALVFETFL